MASRFWVGGTGTWDASSTTHWSASSGGASGASAPTSADDVFIDGNSGAGTITTASPANTAVCRNFDTTGYTGTLVIGSTAQLSINPTAGGTVKFVSTMTLTSAQIAITSATGANCTFTTGGKNITANFTSSTTGGVTVADAWTGACTLTSGVLNTNNQAISWNAFASNNANTRTLTLGSSAITLNGTGTVWSITSNTGLTMTANTATITMTGATHTFSFTGTTLNMNGASLVSTVSGSGQIVSSGALTFANITISGTATKSAVFSLGVTGTLTATGTVSIGGNTVQGVNRLLVQSSTSAGVVSPGTQRTVTAAAYVITGDVDFQDTNLAYSGAASWTNTGNAYIGDAQGNGGAVTTNVTASATQTATGTASFTWSTHGWTSRVPLPQDDVIVNNAFIASRTVTSDMPRLGRSVTFTCTGSPTFGISAAPTLYGNLNISGLTGPIASTTWTLAGRGAQTLTCGGTPFGAGSGVQFEAFGGSYTLQDAVSQPGSSALIHLSGGLDFNNQNVSAGRFDSGSASTRTRWFNGGTGTFTTTRVGAFTAWNIINTGMTYCYAEQLTIDITGTDLGGTKTFNGGGYSYKKLRWVTGSGLLPFTGSNNNIIGTLEVTSNHVVTLVSAVNTTIVNWIVAGQNNGYLYLPGVAANYISTPDSAALDLSGDFTLDVAVAMDKWTPAAIQTLVSKWLVTGNQKAWQFYVNTAGKLVVEYSGDGTTTSSSLASTVAVGAADGSFLWVRVSRSGTTTQFFTSPDGSTWTQLGANVTGTSTAIFNSTALGVIGSQGDGASALAVGKFYRARVFSSALGSGSGTTVFDANFTTKAFGANSFTESSTNAATVTINGQFAQIGDGRVALNSGTAGTAAILSKGIEDAYNNRYAFIGTGLTQNADNVQSSGLAGSYIAAAKTAAMVIPGDMDLRIKMAMDHWVPGSIQTFFARATATAADRTFIWRMTAAGAIELIVYGPSGVGNSFVATAAPVVADGQALWLRATVDVDNGAGGKTVTFYTSPANDGVNWTQLGAPVTSAGTMTIYDSSSVMELGSRSLGTNETTPGKFYRAQILNGINGTIIADANFETTGLVSVTGADYLTVQDSTAAGRGTWFAGRNSVNVSGNTNWSFTTGFQKFGGALAAGSANGSRATTSSRSGGGAAVATAGASHTETKTAAGGGAATAAAGAVRTTLDVRDGGGAVAMSGGAPIALGIARSGGGNTTATAGGNRATLAAIDGGGSASATASSGKVVTVLVAGGATAVMSPGGLVAATRACSGGGVAGLSSGAVVGAVWTSSGGGATSVSASGPKTVRAALAGGGVADLSASAFRVATVVRVGGGVAAATAGAPASTTRAETGGASATAGGGAAHVTLVSLSGGGIAMLSGGAGIARRAARSGGGVVSASSSGVKTVMVVTLGGAGAVLSGGAVAASRAVRSGGGGATASAGATHATLVPRSGGGIATMTSGASVTRRSVRSGGGAATATSGGHRSAIVTCSGGATATAMAVGTVAVTVSTSGGGIASLTVGDTALVRLDGGGNARAAAGGGVVVAIPKGGGATSSAGAGGVRVAYVVPIIVGTTNAVVTPHAAVAVVREHNAEAVVVPHTAVAVVREHLAEAVVRRHLADVT